MIEREKPGFSPRAIHLKTRNQRPHTIETETTQDRENNQRTQKKYIVGDLLGCRRDNTRSKHHQ